MLPKKFNFNYSFLDKINSIRFENIINYKESTANFNVDLSKIKKIFKDFYHPEFHEVIVSEYYKLKCI